MMPVLPLPVVTTFAEVEQGYAVQGLRSGRVELRMVPELGGRIIGLRSLDSDREWCWHRPEPSWLWPSQPGEGFGDSCQAGLDECVPTVAACEVKGRALPDHGEVWCQRWNLDPEALAAKVLQATVSLYVSPLRFTRAIRADGFGAFRFDYALENLGAEPEPFLWSLHPLTTLEPGDRLELPAEVRSLRLDGGIGASIRRGDIWGYPEPFPGIRLDEGVVPGMPRGCVKGFAGPLQTGQAALVNGITGDRMSLRWEVAEVPYLGVWINRGHGGFHHVALEPTTGAPDSLAEGRGDWWGQPRLLAPRATANWSITVEVS